MKHLCMALLLCLSTTAFALEMKICGEDEWEVPCQMDEERETMFFLQMIFANTEGAEAIYAQAKFEFDTLNVDVFVMEMNQENGNESMTMKYDILMQDCNLQTQECFGCSLWTSLENLKSGTKTYKDTLTPVTCP